MKEGNKMEIRIFENKEALSRAAAQYFIEVINKNHKPKYQYHTK